MQKRFQEIISTFNESITSIKNLMKLDDLALEICVNALESGKRIFKAHKVTRGLREFDQQLTTVRNIRTKGKLRPHYETMLNQCVVLLVSYFASAVEDIFTSSVCFRIKQADVESLEAGKLGKEELKLGIVELKERNLDLSDSIGELIVTKKDISFQDMKSIAKAFDDYLKVGIEQDNVVNNIIVGQACRHAIVHSGSVAGSKVLKQIAKAKPRDLKPAISVEEKIAFTDEEITVLMSSMTKYLDNLTTRVSRKLTAKSTING